MLSRRSSLEIISLKNQSWCSRRFSYIKTICVTLQVQSNIKSDVINELLYGEHAANNCREDGEACQRKAGRRMEKTSSGNLFTFFNLWALQISISMNGKVEFSFLGMGKSHESILKMQTMNRNSQDFLQARKLQKRHQIPSSKKLQEHNFAN